MPDVGFFIWKMSSMPKDPYDLVKICQQYGIKRVAIKVLDGIYKYNVPYGDKQLKEYMIVLKVNGIIVEAWGYQYPDQPSLQGDYIEERRQKLEFETFHLNAETPWKEPFGMPKAAKTMLGKLKVNRFEVLLCSYRFPSQHSPFPFDAFMNHEATDGASPQVYWALSHNPVEQLEACLLEYSAWGKPVYPVGPTFGASFKLGGDWVYWEPTVEELVAFRKAAHATGINRMYYYSLDWALAKNRFDWIEAATGINTGSPVDPPTLPPVTEAFVVTNCSWLNGRMEPRVAVLPDGSSNRIVVVRAGQKVENLLEDSDQWQKVRLGFIEAWMHGDYLEPVQK